ncbi:reverse transcriptase domain-containing protein, partial [Tanacetum coccineum]
KEIILQELDKMQGSDTVPTREVLSSVIKGHVQNRNKPEGCIAEETIAKETIEFFSEYYKSMEIIGIPPHKHETDENEEGKPLSTGKLLIPPKNYKDTYDEVDEEFSTVIHHRNDNVLPLVDRRDLANESRDDYYQKDCGGVVIRKSK